MNRYVSNIRSEEVLLISRWWFFFDWIWFIFFQSSIRFCSIEIESCSTLYFIVSIYVISGVFFFFWRIIWHEWRDIVSNSHLFWTEESIDFFSPARQTSWCCRPEFCICFWSAICAALVVGTIVTLAHIPLHHRRDNTIVQQRDSGRNLLRKKVMIFLCFLAPYLLIYAVNLTNMTDLTIIDRISLANRVDNSFFFW